MSSLADRIRGIVAPKTAQGSGSAPAGGSVPVPASFPLAQDVGPGRAGGIEAALGGERRPGCLVIERRWERSTRHGREDLGAVASRLEASAAEAPLFCGGAAARAPFMFFDLETTGLNGGAGTHAFLVGCGWFDGAAFVTRQFLLARVGEERAMLETVAAELARAGAIVSFNGKSFDAPMLETRYLFHRLEWAATDLPHVDVLHPARQFWPQADSCSLITLERQLLGKRRTGDVPGYEIPARYFQFIRSGDARPLAAILEHNRLDLLSLAALAGRLFHLARAGHEEARTAREALALGRVYARAGLESRARDAFMRAIASCGAPHGAFDATKIESLRLLALAWRRARQFDEAARCWQELLDTRGCPAAIAREATEALAIHHEHRLRDLSTARLFAVQTLEHSTAARPTWTDAVRHRLARIDRKITARSDRLL